MPITTGSPSTRASTSTMQVQRPGTLAGRPNFTARSTTGTTLPRRLITPRIHSGVRGTRVTAWYWMISRTRNTPTAYSSSPTRNVRYWGCWALPGVAPCVAVPISEPRVLGGLVATGAGGRRGTDGGTHRRAQGLLAGLLAGRDRGPRQGRGTRLEVADGVAERLRLRGQLLGGGRQLLGSRRVLLRDLVDLAHGPAH